MTTAATSARMARAFAIFHAGEHLDCTCETTPHAPECIITKAWTDAWDRSATLGPSPGAITIAQREALLATRRWSPEVSRRVATLGRAPDSIGGNCG